MVEGCLAVHWSHVEQQVGVKRVDHHLPLLPPSSFFSSLRVSPITTAGEGGKSELLQR